MGDMREYFDDLKEINRDIKLKRKDKYHKYLSKVAESYEVELLSESAQHYRIHLNAIRVDVWATTGKFTVVGSNKYDKGLPNLTEVLENN